MSHHPCTLPAGGPSRPSEARSLSSALDDGSGDLNLRATRAAGPSTDDAPSALVGSSLALATSRSAAPSSIPAAPTVLHLVPSDPRVPAPIPTYVSEQRAELRDWRGFVRPPMRGDAQLEEVLGDYLDDLRRRGSRSVRDIESMMRVHFDPALRAMQVDELTPEHVRAWTISKTAAGYSAEQVRKLLTCLRGVLAYAVEVQALTTNPAKAVRPPARTVKVDHSAKLLTHDEVHAVLRLDSVPFYERLLFAALLLTGTRFGEAAGLSWADYRPTEKPLGELRIRGQWDCKDKMLAPTKTREERAVPVHPALAQLFEEARRHFELDLGRAPKPDDPICYFVKPRTGRAAERWQETTALRRWHAALTAIGTTPRRLHSTRHWFVSELLNRGAHPVASRSLTHATSGRDAYSTYVHTSWAAKCEAVLCLDPDGGGA